MNYLLMNLDRILGAAVLGLLSGLFIWGLWWAWTKPFEPFEDNPQNDASGEPWNYP